MKITVSFEGDQKELFCQSLLTHMEDSNLSEVQEIGRIAKPPSEDALGHEWVEIVQIILSSSLLTTALTKIFEWKTRQKVKTDIEIEVNGSKIKISSNNLEEASEQALQLLEKLEATRVPEKQEEGEGNEELELKPLKHEVRDISK